MNENRQTQPDFYNNHFFSENEKPTLLNMARQEVKREAEEVLGISSLKRKLFEDCFEELGFLKDGKVHTLNDLKAINFQLFNALEQFYTEDVISEFLSNKSQN